MNQLIYDKMYLDRKNYSGPVDIFRIAIQWMSYTLGLKVIDFGCGIGEFAEMLYNSRICSNYIGIDISKVAISRAKKIPLSPSFSFMNADLENLDLKVLPMNTTYVSFQTLEHLSLPDYDIKLISLIPIGCRFIFSVPLNSLNKYHLREYISVKHVSQMYKDILRVHNGVHFKDRNKNKRILVDSVRIKT